MQMSSHAFCFTLRTDFVYRNKDRGRLTRRISAHPTDARDVVSHTTDVGSRKSTLIFLLHELYHNLTRSCVEKKMDAMSLETVVLLSQSTSRTIFSS